MCGRYDWDDSVLEDIRQFLGRLSNVTGPKAGDICPSGQALVLVSRREEISAELMVWGFPKYQGKGLVINARAETALDRPMFRENVQKRRCVVPARAFYEWDHDKNRVTFQSRENKALYMAGMFDSFQGEDRFLVTTTKANESMRGVHDRMPLLLEQQEVLGWLCEEENTEKFLCKKPQQLEKKQAYEQERLPFF